MSSVETAKAAKVDGFKEQLLPLPVVEMAMVFCYNYYCNKFSACRRYESFRNTSNMTELYKTKTGKISLQFWCPLVLRPLFTLMEVM